MTPTINLHQKLDLLRDIIRRWQTIVGSDVIVLSANGEILIAPAELPQVDYTQIIATAPHQPITISTDLQQNTLVAPLIVEHDTLGYIILVAATDTDVAALLWLVDMITERLVDEVALQDMTDELIGAWDQLELVYRVTQNLTFTSDLMAVLRSIVQEIQKVVKTENGFILVERAGVVECVPAKQNSGRSFYDTEFLEVLAQSKQVVLCNDEESCRAVWLNAPETVKTLLATQLPVDEEGPRAALCLINKGDKNFSAGDRKLIAALAQQVGTIIKNFLIHEKLIVEGRLSRELEIAAEIQESLLPTSLPQMGGLAIAVSSNPASEVGGDFYDFITVDDRHLTLVMGDVAGKGIPAAMLTSVTRTMLRVEAMRGEAPPDIIQQANNVLHQDLGRADSFVTVFVATIDTYHGTLNYASAGHTPVLLWRAASRTTEQLRATSPPIGIAGYPGETTQTVKLQPGDTLILYTDGITEAQSPLGDLFGLNRLMYILESRANDSPETLQQYIQAEVSNFRRDAPGRDDATLLIVKMLPKSEAPIPQNISTTVDILDFSFPAEISYLSEITETVTSACRSLPALPGNFNGDDFVYLVELAVSEICTNIVKHAYAKMEGKIDGRITLLNNGIQLDFYDTGANFDPNTVSQPYTDPQILTEGGYGLHIVRQVMDVVSYEHHPKRGNHWYLLKLLPPS